jgi:hypothetical protein
MTKGRRKRSRIVKNVERKKRRIGNNDERTLGNAEWDKMCIEIKPKGHKVESDKRRTEHNIEWETKMKGPKVDSNQHRMVLYVPVYTVGIFIFFAPLIVRYHNN